MIYHCVRLKMKEGVTKDQVDPMLKQLHKMGTEIPSVMSYCVGPDIGGEFDYAAVFAVQNLEGFKAYMDSSIHRKADDLGLPFAADMIFFDVTDEQDQTIGTQILEMHQQRIKEDPGLAKLVQGLESYSGAREAA